MINYRLVFALITLMGVSGQATSQQPALWLDPPDNISQKSVDFHKIFVVPDLWVDVSRDIKAIVLTGNWLLRAPELEVSHSLDVIRRTGTKLVVFIPSLPVDKHVCGDTVEGMIWPGEAALYAKRLKLRGVNVYAFLLDLPFTNGSLSRKPDACKFAVSETANRLASSIHELWATYPSAKIFDAEVPTGRPRSEWTPALKGWLDEYRRAVGRELDGLVMDVWWEFPWIDVALDTANLLHSRNIIAGIYLDADGGPKVFADKWIANARENACQLLYAALPIDLVVIANWTSMAVSN